MAGSRVESMPVPTGTEVYIFAKKDWGTLIFLPVWLAFWTFGGLMAMKWVAHPGPNTPRAFISLWLVGWLLGEVWVAYWWLWTAFGKEIVTVKEGVLNIKRDIFGYGLNRFYYLGSVRNLRASGFFPSNSYWENSLAQMKLTGGTVGFDSDGRTHRFGIQLTEPEANEVVLHLKPYVPEK